jgi:uncharacterized protein YqeY
MEKVNKLNTDLLTARKEKNTLAKNLLSTFKGEYESQIKTGAKEGDETIEAIAKKMTKSAEQVGTDEAKQEIEILKSYLPQMLSEDETRSLVLRVLVENEALVSANNIGALMGMVMKTGAKVDPKSVKGIIAEEINEIQA